MIYGVQLAGLSRAFPALASVLAPAITINACPPLLSLPRRCAGSGKTFTLGTLTRVRSEEGVIPRALSHIFGAIALSAARAQASAAAAKVSAALRPDASPLQHSEGAAGGEAVAAAEMGASASPRYSVSLSFCQLYLDSVQDLLAPAGGVPAPGLQLLPSSSALILPSSAPASASGAATPATLSGHSFSFSAGSGAGAAAAAAAAGSSPVPGAASLPVREDPVRGFYVEGLAEYAVASFADALTLLNWGLENRVLGATRMNATSSRSHTLLTVRVETQTPVPVPGGYGQAAATTAAGSSGGAAAPPVAYVTRRSQLVLVDLAGSERVRRTSSRGARLEEARAINASLHTLGQVIVALSSSAAAAAAATAGAGGPGGALALPRVHCPWRDSKLTKLLHGSLGGNCNTFLIATVAPAPRDAAETLSTLLFASRCMRVAAQPVVASALTGMSNADFADVAARLQARLGAIEGSHAVEVAALQGRYEQALAELEAQLAQAQQERAEALERADAAAESAAAAETVRESRPAAFAGALSGGEGDAGDAGSGRVVPALTDMLRAATASLDASVAAVLWALHRAGRASASWQRALRRAREEEAQAEGAAGAMAAHDPLMALYAGWRRGQQQLTQQLSEGAAAGPAGVPPAALRPLLGGGEGPQLGHAHRSAAAALAAAHLTHASNNVPLPADAGVPADAASGDQAAALAAFSQHPHGHGASSLSLLAPPALPQGASLAPLGRAIVAGEAHGGSGSPAPTSPHGGSEGGPSPFSSAVVFASLAAAMGVAFPPAGEGASAPLVEVLPLVQHPDVHALRRLLQSSAAAPEGDGRKGVDGSGSGAGGVVPAVLQYAQACAAAASANAARLNALNAIKDARFDDVKRHLAAAEASVRGREEDAANQRYVMRYLAETAAALRRENAALRHKAASGAGARPPPHGSLPPGAGLDDSVGGSMDASHVTDAPWGSAESAVRKQQLQAQVQAGRAAGGGSVGGGGLDTPSVDSRFSADSSFDAGLEGAGFGSAGAFERLRQRQAGKPLLAEPSAPRDVAGAATSHRPPVSIPAGEEAGAQPSPASPTPTYSYSVALLSGHATHSSEVWFPHLAAAGGLCGEFDTAAVRASSTAGRGDVFVPAAAQAKSAQLQPCAAGDGSSKGMQQPELVGGAAAQPTRPHPAETADTQPRARLPAQSAAVPSSLLSAPPPAPVAAASMAGRPPLSSASVATAGKPPLPPGPPRHPLPVPNPLRAAVASALPPLPLAGAGPAASDEEDEASEYPLRSGTSARSHSGAFGIAGDSVVEDERTPAAGTGAEGASSSTNGSDGGGDDIEGITGHRYVPPEAGDPLGSRGRLLYCVHWRGSAPDGSEDEYFEREDLLADFPGVVRAYEAANRAAVASVIARIAITPGAHA
jgi:hypothetical protein